MSKGFIYLHRQIQECWVWLNDDKFSQGQAWVDLLLSANHKDVKLPFNGEFVTVERGQLLTSIRKLADRWKWHRNTVKRFLKLLEKDNMIELNVSTKCTIINIVNYDIYQHSDEESVPHTVPPSVPPSVPQGVPSGVTNNNDNNENKYKRKDISKDISQRKNFIPPTVEEVKAYCDERNNGIDAECFVDFYQSKNWMVGKNKMKDWKAAIRTWERNNGRKGVKPNEQRSKSRIDDEQWRIEHREQLDAIRESMPDL